MPRSRSPPNSNWYWKTRDPTNVRLMSIPLAVQEYLHNQLLQLSSETCSTVRLSLLVGEDLRTQTHNVRLARKEALLQSFPALFTGPHGAMLCAEAWLPIYIVQANIPHANLKRTTYNTDFEVCAVLWSHSSYITGLSFYNNHLNPSTQFSHFVVDGATTRNLSENPNTPRRGDGFIRAGQYLFQQVTKGKKPDDMMHGLSFRVGHRIGRLEWHSGVSGLPEQVRVHADKFGPNVSKVPTNENPDEVVITILGLPGNLAPEDVFPGVFSLVPPQTSWCILGRTPQSPTIYFYKPSHQLSPPGQGSPVPAAFYRKHLLVSNGPAVNRLGINYIGSLPTTADRSTVITSGHLFTEYKRHLSAAVDLAFRTIPDLAVELAIDILTDRNAPDSASIGRVLNPSDDEGRDAYRVAFSKALQQVAHKSLTDNLTPYPFCGTGHDLIKELGLLPIPVAPHIRKILEKSGAFPDITVHAESVLLRAPLHRETTQGADHLRSALGLMKGISRAEVSIRQYHHSKPTIVWDKASEQFVMGVPPMCAEHQTRNCLCWVGPYLADAVVHYNSRQNKPVATSSTAEMFRAYLQSMGAVNYMHDSAEIERKDGPIVNGCIQAAQEPTPNVDDDEIDYLPLQKTTPPVGEDGPRTPQFSSHAASPSSQLEMSISCDSDLVKPRGTSDQTASAETMPATSAEGTSSVDGLPDLVSLEDLFQDMRSRVASYVQAESRKGQTQIEEQRRALAAEVRTLRAKLMEVDNEHIEHFRVIAEKDEALMSRNLDLQCKDEMIRVRETRIQQLKHSLREHASRIRGLEDDLKRWEEKEKTYSQALRTEIAGLKKRLSLLFMGSSQQDNESDEEGMQAGPSRKRTRSG
ncbi:uncharacterized protein LAESUDRAFT_727139 [Laetiporus sulphureus 93-53]|uniref:Uncharacterized protein n=1 Tax=Laetiporus sulphureus 93-53 TaxID=1314785 RepID=A0A165DMI3_9APHY|nr:uncharacterized protein LAESUDRAFT_727139 [Laetiporus sulphureus 93-53]KZT05201.1 hypothetical protein LAESUDRAFT_727139 [Laetiporus sulphureus 93-53]